MASGRKDKLWHRDLKDERVECYASLAGSSVHVTGTRPVVEAVLGALEDEVGDQLPKNPELRPKRGTRRGPRPLAGQEQFADVGEPGNG